jgi:hypothetical protein
MRAALNARVLQPVQILLRRTIPEMLPIIPAMLVRMAKKPKAKVSLVSRSLSATFLSTSAVLKEGGAIIISS